MKKILITCFLGSGILAALQSGAQDILKGQPGMYPEQIVFSSGNAPLFQKGSVFIADSYGKISSTSNAVLNHSEKDNLGFEHFRYQQTYAGIPVDNATYVVHVKNGAVLSENGKWIKDFPAGLATRASVGKTAALQKAMDFVGAREYKWQIPAEEAFIRENRMIRMPVSTPDSTWYITARRMMWCLQNYVLLTNWISTPTIPSAASMYMWMPLPGKFSAAAS